MIDNIDNEMSKENSQINDEIKADDKQAMDILMAIKDWGLKHKKLMNDDEFRAIAEQTLS